MTRARARMLRRELAWRLAPAPQHNGGPCDRERDRADRRGRRRRPHAGRAPAPDAARGGDPGLGRRLLSCSSHFGISAEHFASTNNTWILAAVAVIGIVSIGQALAIVSGGFDLSVSGVLPLGAVAFAPFVNHGSGPGGALVLR